MFHIKFFHSWVTGCGGIFLMKYVQKIKYKIVQWVKSFETN